QKAYSNGRQRARRARRRATSATSADAIGGPRLLAGRAGEQALRTQDQNDDHDGVDDEGPEFGDVILARDVGDADQQRGGEGAGNARSAADRHQDQEEDDAFERADRIDAYKSVDRSNAEYYMGPEAEL